LAGARSTGVESALRVITEHVVHPCRACDACRSTGRCIIKDDTADIYSAIEMAQGLVLASPVYFSGFPAQVKALIDRAQVHYWRWEAAGRSPGTRPALLLLVGARDDTARVLQCVRRTLGGWLTVLGFALWGAIAVPNVERVGALPDEWLREARRLGGELAAGSRRRPSANSGGAAA